MRAADSARVVHLCACSQARIFAHKWPTHALRLTQALGEKWPTRKPKVSILEFKVLGEMDEYRTFIIVLLVLYFLLIVFVFLNALRFFLMWFQNSIPAKGILGKSLEVYTMFLNRYLTKEGIEYRGKFFLWLSATIVLCVPWVAIFVFLK